MKLRLIAMLLAVPALVAGLLVVSPAEAISHATYITSKSVTVTDSGSYGLAKIGIRCNSSKPCAGTMGFAGSSDLYRSYSIKAKSSATVYVYMHKTDPAYPETHGMLKDGPAPYKVVTNAKVYVNESKPSNISSYFGSVNTETVSYGGIYYTVNGPTTGLKTLEVERYVVLRGGNILRANRDELYNASEGVNFFNVRRSFRAPLGANNANTAAYRILVTATDLAGKEHSWWWRGVSGKDDGGGRQLRDASAVYGTKGGFVVPINFGTLTGSAPSGTVVKAYGLPGSVPGSGVTRRGFDIPSCANQFGQATAANGSYQIPFLPYDTAKQDKRYLVSATYNGNRVWLGRSNELYGSCSDVTGYAFKDTDLINLTSASTTRDIAEPKASGNTLTANTGYGRYTPTTSDRTATLREAVPGLTVLQSPVVNAKVDYSGNSATFSDVPPGKYWVEVGRRTGCSAWYGSRYSNNKAYLSGADRAAEGWKSFSTLTSLPGRSSSPGLELTARQHGATDAQQGKRPSGYAGWMYRDHCKAYGTGAYTTVNIDGYGKAASANLVDYTGAVVRGRVKRTGGRTNKEMLVRLSSADGRRVLRTDLTDGSGYFYVAGLSDGNYMISVNTDSWRGIGRTFSGKHYIRVTRGKAYNAGTLTFKG